MKGAFVTGQRVRLRYDPDRRGVVRARAERSDGCLRYQVALAGPSIGGERTSAGALGDRSPWYVEADLEALAPEVPNWLGRDDFLRELLLLKLRHPLTDTLYDFRQSRTDFLPYQYLPVLKFLENPDQVILIADEVGLGKTVEACYIYRELAARESLNGVLIVCPSSLRNKWQSELKEKFDEDFQLLNSAGLQELLAAYERSIHPHFFRAIVSYETLRYREHLERIEEADFRPDLVIFDEAHHMRNRATATHKVGRKLVDEGPAAVLLSATPLQTGNENLFHLFQLMKAQDFEDFSDFERSIAPNRHLIQAARLLGARELDDALLELYELKNARYDDFRGNPDYWAVIDELEKLAQADLSAEKNQQRLVRLQRDTHKLNTLAPIFQRTRKREVVYRDREGKEIPPAMRRATNVSIQPHELEERFYHALMRDADADLRRRQVRHRGFARTTRERMAASCLPALRQQCLQGTDAAMFIERSIYDDWGEEEYAGQNGSLRRDADAQFIEVKWSFSGTTRELARALGEKDSKFAQLERVITEILTEDAEPRLGPSKILLFASYIGTLNYLEERLRPLFKRHQLRYALVHGGVDVKERREIVAKFAEETDFRLLISSEVSSEGIDLQFCNTIINYDMPWNPMRVEQRIGRLDRYKQRHEVIRIYNFYLDVDIDTRILQRLHDRIGLFEQSIGDLEHILGPIISDLQKKLMDRSLSEEELEEASKRAEERIRHEREIQQDYDRKARELLSPDSLLGHQIQEAEASGRVIHPEEVRATLQSYLREEFPASRLEPYAGTRQYRLSPDAGLQTRLLDFIQEKRRQGQIIQPISPRLNESLQNNQDCLVTFDDETAVNRTQYEFITYRHPLLELARDYWEREYRGIPALQGMGIETDVRAVQEGHYFLFVMTENSVRSRRNLVSIIITEDGARWPNEANRLLQQLHEREELIALPTDSPKWDAAKEAAFAWIDERRDRQAEESRQSNESRLRAREAAIQRSFSEKIHRFNDQKLHTRSEDHRRMTQGKIRKLQAQETYKLGELAKQRGVTVSYELVATGRVRLLPLGLKMRTEAAANEGYALIPNPAPPPKGKAGGAASKPKLSRAQRRRAQRRLRQRQRK